MSTGNSTGNISGNNISDIRTNIVQNEQVNHITSSSVNIINTTLEESVKKISLNWLPVANCFAGRKDIIQIIKEGFTDKKYVVLHGLPGIGKTETARKFGSCNSDFYNRNLIWISSETPNNIKECFDKLAKSLKLNITDASQIFNQFANSKALIVFDNAENMAAIREYLPCNELYPTVHVLITSHLADWGSSKSICNIPINSLYMEDARSIFKQKLEHTFDEYELEKWEELIQKLDRIPLCLQIVSSLIQQQVRRSFRTKFNLEDFINELEAKLISSTTPNSQQDYYQKSVLAAINSVLSRFENVKAISSLDLLCFVAYLNTDLISDDDLLLIPTIENSTDKLNEALCNLVDYSLIQVVKESDSSNIIINVYRTVQLVLRDYDLTKRNGDMFKTLLKLSLSHELYMHGYSIFKYANMKGSLKKTKEFYHENESLIEEYVQKLVEYYCEGALQIVLPEFKNNRTVKFIQMLFDAIDWDSDSKTILVFFKTVAQNEVDMRQIEIAFDWRSNKVIDILLESNIFKNKENVSKDNIMLKNLVINRFLHSLVRKSSKDNVSETFKCINYLISKWNVDILYQDDILHSNSILHTACLNPEITLEILEYLFQLENEKLKGIVDCQNNFKQTPLYLLFYWNYNNPDVFEIFRHFITKCKADITIKDRNGRNILFYISEKGSFEMIEFILRERDCSQIIFDQDKNGDVAFSQLFSNESIQKMDKIKLIDNFLKNKKELYNSKKHNEIIKKLLYHAVFDQNNNLEIIRLLIENSSTCQITDNDIPCWPSIKLTNTLLQANFIENKISAANKFLYSLVKKSNKENVKQTIECIIYLTSKWDANILYQDDNLNNISHAACANKAISLETVRYLFQLENGKLKEKVNGQNNLKETPLHCLFIYNNDNPDIFEIFRYFINECKADITIQDMRGRNILFYICENGSFEMIEFILRERDCTRIINDQNIAGNVAFTLLIWNDAIEEADKIKLFNLLLSYKMDISLKNKEHKTMLKIAKEKGLHNLTEKIRNSIELSSLLTTTQTTTQTQTCLYKSKVK